MLPINDISFNKETQLVFKVVAIVSAVTVLAGGYTFFVNNIWKPNVKVLYVDFDNGYANLQLPFNRKIDIYGDTQFLIGGSWGVKFGTINKEGKVTYENIQLLKNGLVEEYLQIPN